MWELTFANDVINTFCEVNLQGYMSSGSGYGGEGAGRPLEGPLVEGEGEERAAHLEGGCVAEQLVVVHHLQVASPSETTDYEPFRNIRLRTLQRQHVTSPSETTGYKPFRESRLRALYIQKVTSPSETRGHEPFRDNRLQALNTFSDNRSRATQQDELVVLNHLQPGSRLI